MPRRDGRLDRLAVDVDPLNSRSTSERSGSEGASMSWRVKLVGMEGLSSRSWPLPAATVLARCVGKLPYVSTGCSTINVRHAPPPPCTWVRAHSPTIPRFTRGDKLTSGLGISRALSSSIAHPGRLVRRRPCQSDSVCKRIERKAKGYKDSERNPSSLRPG